MAEPVLLIMGVSGTGKSTVGRALAKALGWDFEEGDDLHPAANVAKMKSGQALDDADRAPWLAAVAAWIDGEASRNRPGIITCSALKYAYRRQIVAGRPQVRIVFLKGSRDLIAGRLNRRIGHFMPPGLLDSQLATLEPPGPGEGAIVVDIDQSVERQVAQIVRAAPHSSHPPANSQS